jgi:hypothetical protein
VRFFGDATVLRGLGEIGIRTVVVGNHGAQQ